MIVYALKKDMNNNFAIETLLKCKHLLSCDAISLLRVSQLSVKVTSLTLEK